jgi:hypothetical protein
MLVTIQFGIIYLNIFYLGKYRIVILPIIS